MSGCHAVIVTRCYSRADFGACPYGGYSVAGKSFSACPCSSYSTTAGSLSAHVPAARSYRRVADYITDVEVTGGGAATTFT